MRVESVQQVMAVLPHRLHNHQWRGGRDRAKDLHAALLAVDEAVALGRVDVVAAPRREPLGSDGGCDRLFDALLRGPASLVRRQAQVAVGDDHDGFGHSCHCMRATHNAEGY